MINIFPLILDSNDASPWPTSHIAQCRSEWIQVISYHANKDRVSDWQDVGWTCDNYAFAGTNLLWVKQWSIMRISAWKSAGDNPAKHLTTTFYEFFIPLSHTRYHSAFRTANVCSQGKRNYFALENLNTTPDVFISLIASNVFVFEWLTILFGVFSLEGAKFSQSFNLLRVFHKSYPKNYLACILFQTELNGKKLNSIPEFVFVMILLNSLKGV